MTYIHGNMTDDGSVVRQPDISSIMAPPIHGHAHWRLGILVHDEGALNIDLDRTWMRDSTVYFGSARPHAEVVLWGSGAPVRSVLSTVFAAADGVHIQVYPQGFRRHDRGSASVTGT